MKIVEQKGTVGAVELNSSQTYPIWNLAGYIDRWTLFTYRGDRQSWIEWSAIKQEGKELVLRTNA